MEQQCLYPSKREAYNGLINEAILKKFPFTDITRLTIHSIYWDNIGSRDWDGTSSSGMAVTELINKMRIELDNMEKFVNEDPRRINYNLSKTGDYFDEFGEGKFSS